MDKKYFELKKMFNYPFLVDPTIVERNIKKQPKDIENKNHYSNLMKLYLTSSNIDENILLMLYQKCILENTEPPLELDKIEEILKDAEPVTDDISDEEIKTIAPIEMGFRTASGKKISDNKQNSLEENQRYSKTTNKQKNDTNDEDKRLNSRILSTIVNISAVNWSDIAGLDRTKSMIKEIVVWPMLRPDLFTGLRSPPKGILLFGPPGTGKTMLGKCIASQIDSTFFSISASSLTSKWMGEGEKTVKALFQIAREKAPSVIFIDEIDSLLSKRAEGESEGGRKIKTEFLVQFDGILSIQSTKRNSGEINNTNYEKNTANIDHSKSNKYIRQNSTQSTDGKMAHFDQNTNRLNTNVNNTDHIKVQGRLPSQCNSVLVIGATNRPQEIDEAVRRRFVKRVYVPLPDSQGIHDLLKSLLSQYDCAINEQEFLELSNKLKGYSGSDIYNLCRETVMEPLREIDLSKGDNLRPINQKDIIKAMDQIRKSVSLNDLEAYEKWNDEYGSK